MIDTTCQSCGHDRSDHLEAEQASLCDLLNTWAREEGVQQAERPSEMKSLADRLWGHLSRRVSTVQARGATDERERLVKIAEKLIAESPSGMRSHDSHERCQGYRQGLYDFIERAKSSSPAPSRGTEKGESE